MSERGDSKDTIADLLGQLGSATEGSAPPIHLWNPEHCGDIDMEIRRDGSWWHEGRPIKREKLVKLFASVLRREEDGEYYLVTPVEKARITVELHPLLVTDVDYVPESEPKTLLLSLNTGGQVLMDEAHPPKLEPRAGHAVYVEINRGLTALFSRSAWYRLASMLDDKGQIESAGQHFNLLP
ncbi:conserved hypothetical protein [Luminiphilus syltensis NOR5-1B]|uniref:Proteophosphoglycan n=1 Tax=Luminiphilus syltensis NOR5-1B TaxID=565045 RepID=B8KQX5_9GAMM|nr:DUF1285 domain-containing protein [Luminiphilus syltensis]EED36679.1 conserved hypothetical protein [Luminiphilus syltensis NOR5-1B]